MTTPQSQPSNLNQVGDRVETVAQTNDRVSLGSILENVGTRSFGVLLLIAGIVILAPLVGDIPGVPSLMAILVLLTSVQLLMRRQRLWLPGWLLNRSISAAKMETGVKWIRKFARLTDRFIRPRMSYLVQNAGVYAVALACVVIALLTPAMEVVPFSANGAGAALTAFGLSLTARDGLLALLAHVFTLITLGAVIYLWL